MVSITELLKKKFIEPSCKDCYHDSPDNKQYSCGNHSDNIVVSKLDFLSPVK